MTPLRLIPLAAVLVALLACAASASAATYPSGFEERTMISGLTMPTAVDWTPDGRTVIIEKGGLVKVAAPGATTASTVLDISSQVNANHDRGLLGLAVDSSFASNKYLWLLYTYELTPSSPDSGGRMVSRLLRVTLNDNNTVTGQTPILGTYVSGVCPTPTATLDCIPSDGLSHSIGTVLSAPDGTLYLGSGDAASYSAVDSTALRTYDENSLAGKILRVDRTGRGVAGHSFCPAETDLTKNCTKLFAKGFRNPFRFSLRPSGAGLTIGDVGWNTREEVDIVRSGGKNYGWPCYEGTVRTPGYRDLAACGAEYAKESTPSAATGPSHDYDRSGASSAVMGGPTYTGTAYPAGYRDQVFFADYAQGFIRRMTVNGSDQVTAVTSFATGWAGVQLNQAPDGDLAFVSFGTGAAGTGSVKRIAYAAGNRTPVAAAAGTPRTGNAPLTVAFSSAGSSDPDGDTLRYRWDFGDGSAASTAANPSHTYTATGRYTATLTVDDGRGRSDSKTVTIDVGNGPPAAAITAPADGTLYDGGQSIQLTGTGTDTEDGGTLPASAFSWRVTLHHADHTHPYTVQQGIKTPTFVAGTDHDADSYFEVTLTVTDSSGQTDEDTIALRPRTSSFAIESQPAGAPVSYSGTARTTPFTTQAAVGYRTTVTAAASFTQAGRTYTFDRWSDGGARVHDVTIAASATTLTAVYEEVGVSPVLELGFDDGAGATAADASGRGNAGALSGPSWTAGKYGGALDFDGVNDWVTVADAASLDLAGEMTLEAWVRPRTLQPWRTVLMKEAPPDDHAYAIYASNSLGNPGGYSGTGNIAGAEPLPTGAWSHVTYTNDATGAFLYVNGELVGAGPSRPAPATAAPLRIGGNSLWLDEFFNGAIDEVRIYDKALSPAEIEADMTTPVNPGAPTDTTPPTVSIGSPAAGATVSGAVQVQAAASDDVGVTSVQFKLDGNDLGGPDTGAPYATSWDTTTAGNGTHRLTAVARDAAGNTRTSAEVTVTVSNGSSSGAPVLALGLDENAGTTAADASGAGNTGRTRGAAWTPGRYGSGLSLDGLDDWLEVSDSPSLDLTRDMTLELWVKPRTLAAWRTLLMKEAPDGYAYSLYATNSAGLPGGYVGMLGGGVVGGDPLPANAWSHLAFTNDGSGSKLYLNGNLVGSGPSQTTAASAGALHVGGNSVWSNEFLDGVVDEVRVYSRALSAEQIATDMATPIGSPGPPPDTTNPTVSLTAPAGGATVSGANVALAASASDNVGVQSVQFRVNGADLGSADTSSPYGTTWNTTGLANGNYTLSAVARDAAGNTATSSAVVTVSNATPDTTAPNVSLTAPASGATVSGTSAAVSANASDNVGVASVQFRLDGNDLGAADTSSPYGTTWNTTTATNGTHTLTAVARDAAGNSRTATNVTVTVNNVPAAAAPVLALGFNDGSGSTARDSSPSRNNGTLSGATWTTSGKAGGALSFDGSNDRVTVPDASSLDLTTALTLEAWVRPRSIGRYDPILLKETSGGSVYDLYATNSALRPAVDLGNYQVSAPSGSTATNTWTHIAATYDGSVARLYVNGTQVAARTGVPNVPTSSGSLRIGGTTLWTGEWFNGYIDELRIYNRALSQADIAADMSTPIAAAVSAARRYGNAKTTAKDAKKLKRASKKPRRALK